MIETFFGAGTLDTPQAWLAAFLIGLGFGFALERAGFGSSRRLAGVFYLTDMAVVKVMFSAMITAMLGLVYLQAFGWIGPDEVYFMPTIYEAQVVGGLIFGVGFVMAGWCPGTAAVGAASGKLDAWIFLGGAIIGSILFNEVFPLLQSLYTWGDRGVVFIYQTMHMTQTGFAFLFTLLGVVCFWLVEFIEWGKGRDDSYFGTPFLKSLSLVLLIAAGGLVVTPGLSRTPGAATMAGGEAALLSQVEVGQDHVDPEDLADRLMRGEPGLLTVDVRSPEEFRAFHIRGAVNVPLTGLIDFLAPYKNRGAVVLYSNGMTHPAQARDALYRLGFRNVAILTDGLKGFMERCLKPVSLRSEPVPASMAARINAWRAFFLAAPVAAAPGEPGAAATAASASTQKPVEPPKAPLPGLVDTAWLAHNLDRAGLAVIDLRSQPEYNSGHIPGAQFLAYDSLRGVVHGVPSMLLPAPMLAAHFSQMGISPSDLVVLVPGDKLHDATLVGLALERLGHHRYAVLEGGMKKWLAEKRPMDTRLPVVSPATYPVRPGADSFIVNYRQVQQALQDGKTVILDVRPKEYYTGQKQDEARGGHIPGAKNRPFTEDVVSTDTGVYFKPAADLAQAYGKLIPSKETLVIVHCRTGHQASQAYFVLKHLLGYKNVRWYDAGWTEWAARPELPVEK